MTGVCSRFYCTSSGLRLFFHADGQLSPSLDLKHFTHDEYEQASAEGARQPALVLSYAADVERSS